MPTNPSAPGSLPDALQARLRLGLKNWAKRTLLWSAFFGIFSMQVPWLKGVLVVWLIFSAVSLVFLLLGLKFAKFLQTGRAFSVGVGGFPQGASGAQARDFSSSSPEFPPQASPDEPPPRAPSGGPNEVIEIDAEVLPPEAPPPHRTAKAREIHEG